MKKSESFVAIAENLRGYHARMLSLLQENLNPTITHYFKKFQDRAPMLDIDPLAPQYIRNMQVMLNLMLVVERGLTTYSNDDETIIDTLFNLGDYCSTAFEAIGTLQHFDLKAGPETQSLFAVLRKQDPELLKNIAEQIELPEVHQLIDNLRGAVDTKVIHTMTGAIEAISMYFSQEDKQPPLSNQAVVESILSHSSPTLEQTLELKDQNQRYIVNPITDNEIITSIKNIGNSLDYLSKALSFDLNRDNGKLISGIVEGVLAHKEVLDNIYALSPAVIKTSAKYRALINEKAEKVKPALRELILNTARIEDELCLRPGYFLDQIRPFVKRYFEFCKTIAIPPEEDKKNDTDETKKHKGEMRAIRREQDAAEDDLFFSQRQQLRLKRYNDTRSELGRVVRLRVAVEQVKDLLNTNYPLASFSYENLHLLLEALPLLSLPTQLHDAILAEIRSVFSESKSYFSVFYDTLKTMAGRDSSLRNQLWRAVSNHLNDIKSYEQALDSSVASIKYSWIHELLNEEKKTKPVVVNNRSLINQLNPEECEFFLDALDVYTTTTQLNEAEKTAVSLMKKHIATRTASESEDWQYGLTSPWQAPTLDEQEKERQELAQLALQINARNCKMAGVIKELRGFLLDNIKLYFSTTVVDNIENSTDSSGIIQIRENDPKHIQDMKNMLSALSVLENIFRTNESSTVDALEPAYELYNIASRFHLDYGQQVTLFKVVLGEYQTKASEVTEQLTAETQSGLSLKPAEIDPEADQKAEKKESQGFFEFYNNMFYYPETVYSYLNFDEGEGSGKINLQPYVEQMRSMEDRVEKFLQDFFQEDFSQLFSRDATTNLYNIEDDDPALAKDAKNLLNAFHHITTVTGDVNTFLHGTHWDIIAVLNSVSTFINTLNSVDLPTSNLQARELMLKLLAGMQTAVDEQINPLLSQIIKDSDNAEQAIGLRPGVLTNHMQSLIEVFQDQCINAGIKITEKDDNAFLMAREEARVLFVKEAEGKILELEVKRRDTDNQFALIDRWHQEVSDVNQPIPSFMLLLELRDYIRRNSEAAQLDKFIPLRSLLNDAPLLDGMINNYQKFLGNDKAEFMEMFALIREQIIIGHSQLKANQAAIANELNELRYRIQIVQEHQEVSAHQRETANEAIEKVKHAEHTMKLALESKEIFRPVLLAIAEINLQSAQELATQSHHGSAKRIARNVQPKLHKLEKELHQSEEKSKFNKNPPSFTPKVPESNLLMYLLKRILTTFVTLLDNLVYAIHQLRQSNNVSPSETIETSVLPTEPVSTKPEFLPNTNAQPSSTTQTSNLSVSVEAATKTGHFAPKTDQRTAPSSESPASSEKIPDVRSSDLSPKNTRSSD